MVENWVYAELLRKIPYTYTVIGDRVSAIVGEQTIDLGNATDVARMQLPQILDKVKSYQQLKERETVKKMEEQATKDGAKFGDFLLFMNPNFADYAGWWDIGMIFAKLMGYGTLETGVAFVTSMNSRIALYREANVKLLATRREE